MDISVYRRLMDAGRGADRLSILALAGVISMMSTRPTPYDRPIAGLERDRFAGMMASAFPGFQGETLIEEMPVTAMDLGLRTDEFDDLLELLLAHRTNDSNECLWVACAIATASMGGNHLWQDLGMPDRTSLSRLIERTFTSLFIRNVGDMKWKKFFYRELCERAEVMICKSPSCVVCVDYKVCFGSEDGLAQIPLASIAGAPNSP